MFTTNRCFLRLATENDAAEILDFYTRNQDHLSPWEPRPPVNFYSLSYWKNKLSLFNEEFLYKKSLRLFIFLKENEKLIGNINFTTFERGPFQNCRVGYKIDQDYQGQGLMKESLESACGYVFEKLNFHRIEANYLPRNQRSATLLESLGFEKHGVAKSYLKIAGKWEDHVQTSLINTSWQEGLETP